jgi:hypothetical protein
MPPVPFPPAPLEALDEALEATEVEEDATVSPVELAPLTLGEHDDNRLRLEAPCDEGEHLCRRLVKPLRVVDQTEKRLLVGRVGKKTQEREPD